MAKIKQEDGTEIEVLTKEEHEAAMAVIRKENEDALVKAKADAEAEAKKAKEDLEKEREKEKNFSKVKTDAEKIKEEADKKVADIQNELNTLKGVVVGNTKDALLSKLSKGDAELKKKIELEYSQFQGEATTESEISDRMLKAVKLAVPTETISTLDDAFSRVGGRGQGNLGTDPKAPTENEKKIGDAMGISDADRAKYAPKV